MLGQRGLLSEGTFTAGLPSILIRFLQFDSWVQLDHQRDGPLAFFLPQA